MTDALLAAALLSPCVCTACVLPSGAGIQGPISGER